MPSYIIAFLFGSFSVVIFDTLGSFASKKFGFNYSILTLGSYLIYFFTGYLSESTLLVSAFLAGFVGLVDATIGWRISWIIGPGKIPEDLSNKSNIIKAIVIVTLTACVFGLIGGLIS